MTVELEGHSAAPARSWFPQDPPPSPRRLRKHVLTDQVRALVVDLLELDVEAADEAGLDQAEQLLALAARHIADLPRVTPGGMGVDAGIDASLFERSPLSGRSNALAAPLQLWGEGERTRGHATFGSAHEGPPGSVHGGHVIATFDDLLGVAQAASGTAGLTGTLSVRLLRRTPLHERIDYEGGVASREGRKVEAWGRSTHDGQLLAEATAVFIRPRSLELPAGPSHDDRS